MNSDKKIAYIPLIQGIYFFITLVWPVIHIESFMWVTGWKTDIWLVKTVSALLLPYSLICFWIAFNQKSISSLIILTMLTTGLGLATVEIYYYLNGTIRWVYFVDALLQLVFIIWWLLQWGNLNQTKKFPHFGNKISS